MTRTPIAGLIVTLFIAGCGTISPHPDPVKRPAANVTLTGSDFGNTVKVAVGQTVEVDVPGWDISTQAGLVLNPVSGSQPGKVRYKAVAPGSEFITAKSESALGCANPAIDCAIPAPRYGRFAIIAVPPQPSVDFAVSELDNGKTFLLTPGLRIVTSIQATALVDSNPAVLAFGSLDGASSLSLLTAQRPGLTTLSANGRFDVSFLVRAASSRYDVVASTKDGGRTIRVMVGQTLAFQLDRAAGFRPWQGGNASMLREVVDPSAETNHATTFVFLVRSPGTRSIEFEDDPVCSGQDTCGLLSRTIDVSLEAAG